MHQLLAALELLIAGELEGTPVEGSDVGLLPHLLEVLFEGEQLGVLAAEVGKNGDAVVALVEVGDGRVVYQHHVGERTIDDADVLRVDVVLEADAVLAVEAVLDEFVLEIELIEDGVGVGALTSSEGNDLEVLGSSLEEAKGVRSNRNVSLFSFIRDLHFQVVFTIALEIAVEEGLIQIDDEHLLAEVLLLLRKEDLVSGNRCLIRQLMLPTRLQNLQRNLQVLHRALIDASDPLGQL